AMQDDMLQYIRVALSNQATYGAAAKRNGSKVISGFAVPSGIYPCKPGGPNDYLYVYTSRTNPVHWQRLLEVIGRKDLIGDPRFDTAAARLKHEPEVDALIAASVRKQGAGQTARPRARPRSPIRPRRKIRQRPSRLPFGFPALPSVVSSSQSQPAASNTRNPRHLSRLRGPAWQQIVRHQQADRRHPASSPARWPSAAARSGACSIVIAMASRP